MKTFFRFMPWLLTIAGVAAIFYFSSVNNKLTAQIVVLRPEADEISELERENAQWKKTPSQTEEIVRLKRETADLLKMRNESRRLRDENRQMKAQLQAAQANLQRAEAAVAGQVARAQRQPSPSFTSPEYAPQTCINNLRQIDGAKQQWGLENKKTDQAIPIADEIAPYIKGGFPKCPAGGIYSLNSLAGEPTCSVPGHQLPQ